MAKKRIVFGKEAAPMPLDHGGGQCRFADEEGRCLERANQGRRHCEAHDPMSALDGPVSAVMCKRTTDLPAWMSDLSLLPKKPPGKAA